MLPAGKQSRGDYMALKMDHSRLAQVQDTYRSLSTELTLDEWQRRTRGQRYLDNVMRLTAALQ